MTASARGLLALLLLAAVGPGRSAEAPAATARVEARSGDLLAVGTVRGDRMSVYLSRLADNAPVRDATLNVVLRGTTLPANAEADGSYLVRSSDLEIQGSAAVVFDVATGTRHEQLTGTLAVGGPPPETHDGSRQMLWWVLNSAVCVGFLLMWNRRRRRSEEAD